VKMDDNQLTLNDSKNLRCRLWKNCAYHTCKGKYFPECDAYHDPRKNPNIDLERD